MTRSTDVGLFGITANMDDKDPTLHVSRDRFPIISGRLREDAATREEVKRATLQIVRAILEKSRRMWEFVWMGTRISAPVTDPDFYRDLYARKVNLATGDLIEVDLTIKQKPIGETGIFENASYEVRKVHSHTPRPVQESIDRT